MSEDVAAVMDQVFDLVLAAGVSPVAAANIGFNLLTLGLSQMQPENRATALARLPENVDCAIEQYKAREAPRVVLN